MVLGFRKKDLKTKTNDATRKTRREQVGTINGRPTYEYRDRLGNTIVEYYDIFDKKYKSRVK